MPPIFINKQNNCFSANEEEWSIVKTYKEGVIYKKSDLEKDSFLNGISEWSFPIFTYNEKHPKTVLSRVSFRL